MERKRRIPVQVMYGTVTIGLVVALVAGGGAWWWQNRKVVELNLAAGQEGALYLPLAKTLRDLVKAQNPRIRIRVQTSAGSQENLQRIRRGEAQLALVQNDSRGGPGIRTLAPLHRDVLHMVAASSSEIETVEDFAGSRVGLGPRGSGSRPVAEEILAYHGLGLDEMTVVEVGLRDAVEKLQTGGLDGFLLMTGVRSPALVKLAQDRGFRLVPVGRNLASGSAVEGFLHRYPFGEGTLLPRMVYAPETGEHPSIPPATLPSVAVRNLLVCRDDLAAPVARALAETVFQNRSTLAQKAASVAQLTEDFDRGRLQYPLHEGAEQYLARDQPGWLAQHAELLGLFVSLLAGLIGAVAAARQWWHQRLKDRIDVFYLELNEFLTELRRGELTALRRREIRRELQDIRVEAFRLLVDERLPPDAAFQIFQELLHECDRVLEERAMDARPG